MLNKRITTQKRLVSQFDDAFVLGFEKEQKEEYLRTLDIDKLGSFKDLRDKPTIFKVDPLQSKYEYMVRGIDTDMWDIFASHVKGVEYYTDLDDRLEFENGVVAGKYRDLIPRRTYEEIAGYIVGLADQTSDSVFFSRSVESLRYEQAVLNNFAMRQSIENVHTVDAINKNTK